MKWIFSLHNKKGEAIGDLVVYEEESALVASTPSGEVVSFGKGGQVFCSTPNIKLAAGAELDNIPLELPKNTGGAGISPEGRIFLERALGLQQAPAMPPENNVIQLADIALRYRFKHYGAPFIVTAKSLLANEFLAKKARDVLALFPRSISAAPKSAPAGDAASAITKDSVISNTTAAKDALDKLLFAAHLPNTPDVCQAAAHHPNTLAILATIGGGVLCGGSPKVAVRMLESSCITLNFAQALLGKPHDCVCNLLAEIAQEEPALLFEALQDMTPQEVAVKVDAYESMEMHPVQLAAAYKRCRHLHNHHPLRILDFPSLLTGMPAVPAKGEIFTYQEPQRLEGYYLKYHFVLPRSYSHLTAAARELGSHLNMDYAEQILQRDALIVLVHDGPDLRVLIRIDIHTMAVTEVYGKNYQSIAAKDPIASGITLWAQAAGVCLDQAYFEQ